MYYGDTKTLAVPARDRKGQEMFMSAYDEIVCIEAELSGYRRGSLRVSIDMDKKLIHWKDSHQWNNNFMRSISTDKMKLLCDKLPTTHILQWSTHYTGLVSQDDIKSCHDADWTVVISFRHKPQMRIVGSNQFPQEWRAFREMIESIAKIPFRLR